MRTLLRSTVIALLVCAAAWPARAQQPVPIRRVAILIGANDAGKSRPKLRFAASDARSVAGVLQTLGGVDPADQLLLVDPDRQRVVQGFQELRERIVQGGQARRVELFVYYSGHSDEMGLLLGEEHFLYREFREQIDQMPADVRIAIVDSCSSGAMTRRKGGTWRPPFMVDDSTQVQGHAILTSSAAHEAAQESDRIGGSFFTHYLLTGLRGAADASSDGLVTLNEAYHYAFNETLARTELTQAGAQHPAYDIQLSGTGDLVMTDLRSANATLSLAPELDGRLFVRDAKGRLAAEVRKAPGRRVDLGLESGSYSVTLVAGEGQVYAARVQVAVGRRTDLTRLQLTPRQVEVAVRRGGQFVEPPPEVLAEAPENVPGDEPATLTPGEALNRVAQGLEQALAPLSRIELPRLESSRISDLPRLPWFGADDHGVPPGYDVLPLKMSLLPGLATGPSDHTVALLSLNVLMGRTARVRGIEAGFGFNQVTEELRGLQLAVGGNINEGLTMGVQAATGFNVTVGDLRGMQGASGFNVTAGRAMGVQAAGGFNVTAASGRWEDDDFVPFAEFDPDRMRLIQMAGGFNVAGAGVVGAQGSGGFNVAGGGVSGLQAAGGFNVAGGPVSGAQLAGGFNAAGDVTGAQVSVLNIGGDVHGAQVGVINIARVVHGTQVGVLNISEDFHGVPVGLLNISRRGLLHLQGWSMPGMPANVGLQFGTRHVYTLVSMGLLDGRDGRSIQSWSPSLGLGVNVPMGRFFAHLDVSGGNPRSLRGDASEVMGQARLGAGFKVFERFAVIGGLAGNVLMQREVLSDRQPLPNRAWGVTWTSDNENRRIFAWGTLYAGLQF